MDSDLPITVHTPLPARDRRVAIFYLHGGGLLCGVRDDLPRPYVEAFTDAGYTLICADYPLAPETSLPNMVDKVFGTWQAAVGKPLATGTFDGYALFGRSAGAYLALLLAREIGRRRAADGAALPQPRAILSFYGYYDITDKALRAPAKAYSALPEVSLDQARRIVQSNAGPMASGALALRYALYVYARQHQDAWAELLGLDGSGALFRPEAWSLTAEELHRLPPVFAAASTGDEDIPYRMSKALVRTVPGSTMKTVYYLPHDFDRDTNDPAGREAYRAALAWLDQQLASVQA